MLNHTCLAQYGLSPQQLEQIAPVWQLSQASFPGTSLYFAQEDYLKHMADLTSLNASAVPVLLASGAKIRSQEPLARFAWHAHWMLHCASHDIQSHGVPWQITPEGCSFFPAIVLMAAVPALCTWYDQHGIPEAILRDSLTVLDVWAQDYKEKYGIWGYNKGWMTNHLIPTIFRLHRLEFELSSYHSPSVIFRHNTTGKLTILAPDAMDVAADGFFCQPDQPAVFTTSLTMTDYAVTGYPTTADGRVDSKAVTLPFSEWSRFIEPHDPVIAIHIPAAAPLDYDECAQGIQQAREFFPKYFPEFKFKAFICGSWLLDPTLRDILPPDSNIVRFQSLFNLYPAPNANDWQTRERVFGNPDLDMDHVPQRTSLQRNVREKILSGHRFRGESMILP